MPKRHTAHCKPQHDLDTSYKVTDSTGKQWQLTHFIGLRNHDNDSTYNQWGLFELSDQAFFPTEKFNYLYQAEQFLKNR